MTFEFALRLTEILLGFALLQQSLEHLAQLHGDRPLFVARGVLSLALMMGIAPSLTVAILLGIGVVLLVRYDGPYNGGSDRMSLLILICLCAAHLAPAPYWQQVALAYLAAQLVLSYVLSGAVKIVNPDWRNGAALCDVFFYSAYPASEAHRGWARQPALLLVMSWAVMLFELAFPLALLTQTTLVLGLTIAALFHLANAYLFGLNRFVWAWIAAYPSILWLQDEVIGPLL